MSLVIQKVISQISDALAKDQLVLPTLPEVALRVRDAAQDPDIDLSSLSDEISNDPALSARIVKVANSPLHRTVNEIKDVKMAVMRLGIDYTVNIATAIAMEQMFQATSDIIDKRMRDVWLRSSEIARTGLKADIATLGGLVHQIGVLPILSFAEEHPFLLRDEAVLDSVIEKIHPAIGDRILQKWGFPEELQPVPTQHLVFNRKAEQADYVDLVTVAMLQSHMGNNEFEDIDHQSVTAFNRLGLEADTSAQAEDISEEMKEAANFLNT